MNRIVIKYGGNAMRDASLQRAVVSALISLKKEGFQVVVVHGGGPFIGRQLELAGIESDFADGHRITTPEAMAHVEIALKGQVNGQLVGLFNQGQSPAIGLSGKDAQMVRVVPRLHQRSLPDGRTESIDLGRVGDVQKVDTSLLYYLLEKGITPVIACIGADERGLDYNVNADMMAGHIAGALAADHFLVLTDIDGLRRDVADPHSHIDRLTVEEVKSLFGTSIQGGMIPKMEACIIALQKGARQAAIINGTKPELIAKKLMEKQDVGTTIVT